MGSSWSNLFSTFLLRRRSLRVLYLRPMPKAVKKKLRRYYVRPGSSREERCYVSLKISKEEREKLERLSIDRKLSLSAVIRQLLADA